MSHSADTRRIDYGHSWDAVLKALGGVCEQTFNNAVAYPDSGVKVDSYFIRVHCSEGVDVVFIKARILRPGLLRIEDYHLTIR